MYRIIPQNIPQSRRKEINEKIIFSLSTSKPLPPETVYNCYTGDGGLHGLERNDYDSYHSYAEAKKEIENGQFLTPHDLCRDLVSILDIKPEESVIEMCCGTGNFINWLPNHRNVRAFDLDAKAVTVAKYLYPDAEITREDLLYFEPSQKYDIALGNPPFNLDIKGQLSQMLWLKKSASCLAPGGLLLAIVPASFLADDFQDKSKIEEVNSILSFIGQADIDKRAFSASGVDCFATKVMVFHKKAESLDFVPYVHNQTITLQELAKRITDFKACKASKRLELTREQHLIDVAESDVFEYKVKKYLYEIKTHENIRRHHDAALALVTKYRNQKPPENATKEQYELWEKSRLHAAGVLAVLKRYIREQDIVTRKEVALVKTNYGFKLKAYAPKLMDHTKVRTVSMHHLMTTDCSLPHSLDKLTAPENQYEAATRLVNKKRARYRQMIASLEEYKPSSEYAEYAEKATFINAEGKLCHFTALQKKDLALILSRRYCLLNWQQGSGKTAAVFHRAKFLLDLKQVKNTVIIAPAIAIKMTWEPFLKRNGVSFVTIRKGSDTAAIKEGDFVVISATMLSRLEYQIKRFIKLQNKKLCLVFDESDELTNPSSQRTKLTLSLFRRLKYKILATGTTTRNNIAELYSQIELLYNNSSLMTNWCHFVYGTDEDGDIINEVNDDYGYPFPPRGGYRLFRKCHCPIKNSVFGIEKMNQDVYNSDELKEIINRTVLTRKFRDFAGDRYTVSNHPVTPTASERNVYDVVIKEFHRICRIYFQDTGNARKEAGLRLARQIRLLIKACSTPNLMEGYDGKMLPTKTSKIASIIAQCKGKVAIGCTSLETVYMYEDFLKNRFPERRLHVITGEVEFKKRSDITQRFNSSEDDILLCTQQSLSSSVNIPDCDDVIVESLQWNIPRMEQFYFRFIRLDSERTKRVHFVTYEDSLEQNVLALVLAKERLNDFIRTGEVLAEDEIYDEFGIGEQMLHSFLGKETDHEGHIHLTWGHQKVS